MLRTSFEAPRNTELATELHLLKESTARFIEPADVIKIENTPSPPALSVASTLATTLGLMILIFADTPSQCLEGRSGGLRF